VQAFTVVGCKTPSTGVRSIYCVTGSAAENARKAGIEILERVTDINDLVEMMDKAKDGEDISSVNKGDEALAEVAAGLTPQDLLKEIKKVQQFMKKATLKNNNDEYHKMDLVPYVVRCEVEGILDELNHHLKKSDRSSQKTIMEGEILAALEEQSHLNYVVHVFETRPTTKMKLSTITKRIKDKPVLALATDAEKYLYGRAQVPKAFLKDKGEEEDGSGGSGGGGGASAQAWMYYAVMEAMGSRMSVKESRVVINHPSTQSRKQVVNFKLELTSEDNSEELMSKISDGAVRFAQSNF